jgi:hypothetical protein
MRYKVLPVHESREEYAEFMPSVRVREVLVALRMGPTQVSKRYPLAWFKRRILIVMNSRVMTGFETGGARDIRLMQMVF